MLMANNSIPPHHNCAARGVMNNNLYNRIYNDKYRSATSYVKDESEPVKELIGALARVLGNVGWFDEREEIEEEIRWGEVEVKDLKIILKHALENIGYGGGKK